MQTQLYILSLAASIEFRLTLASEGFFAGSLLSTSIIPRYSAFVIFKYEVRKDQHGPDMEAASVFLSMLKDSLLEPDKFTLTSILRSWNLENYNLIVKLS